MEQLCILLFDCEPPSGNINRISLPESCEAFLVITYSLIGINSASWIENSTLYKDPMLVFNFLFDKDVLLMCVKVLISTIYLFSKTVFFPL